MKLQALSVCASTALAALLVGVVSPGTASATPTDPLDDPTDPVACHALQVTVQQQLMGLIERNLSDPFDPKVIESTRAILASIDALQKGVPDCPLGPIPSIEQLMPPPTQRPSIPAEVIDECGRAAQFWAGAMDDQPMLIPILSIMGADVLAFCDGMKALGG